MASLRDRKDGEGIPQAEGVPGIRAGEVFAGFYLIVRVLGEGGMGVVYLARDLRVENRQVALKVQRPRRVSAEAPESRGRQTAEARLLASCEHPSILPVFDAGADAATGLSYFTMRPCLLSRRELERLCDNVFRCPYPRRRARWAAGPCALTLRDLLEGGKALPETAVARIGIDLVDALSCAHGHEPPIIHRDIKPSNILFDSSGRAILSDFGIARDMLGEDSATGSATPRPSSPGAGRSAFAGTPVSAAPEQRARAPASPASDYYSLGLVLHEALTGERHSGGTAPTQYDPRNISRPWDALLRRLLATDPRERLASPDEIRDVLRAILRHASPRPPRIAAAFLAAMVCALCAGAVFLLRGGRHTPVRLPGGPPPVVSLDHSVTLDELLGIAATNPVFIPSVPSEVAKTAERLEETVRKMEALRDSPPWPTPSTNYFPDILVPARPENNYRHSAGQVFEMRLPGGTPLQFVPVSFGPGLSDRLDQYRHGDFLEPGEERYRLETALDDRFVAVSKRLMVSRTEITREQFDDVLSATNPVPLWEMTGADWADGPALMAQLGMGEREYGIRLRLLLDSARARSLVLSGLRWRTVFARRPFGIPPPQGMPAAEGIRFRDVERFIDKLNDLCPPGGLFRLPTEAEWESICRCRTFLRFEGMEPGTVCWSRENSGSAPHPVARKAPNAFGAYDFHGNVAEWCLDGFSPMERPAFDPVLPVPSNGWHVVRGGSWADPAGECDSDSRRGAGPDATGIGFRLVLEY